MKKIVVKVGIDGHKSKREVMKAVARLEGIDQLTIDEAKGTVTVVGVVDPVLIVKELRKIKKRASIDSVGPPPKPAEKEKEKAPSPPEIHHPPFPNYIFPHYDPYPSCYCRW